MAGKFIEGHGILGVKNLVSQVVTKLLANGFVQIYPSTPFDPATDTNVIVKAGDTINSLATATPPQDWAIKFEWDDPTTTDGMCDVYVATPLQFDTTTGDHATFKINNADPSSIEALGILGCAQKNYLGGDADIPADIEDFPQMFLNRDRIARTFLHRHHIPKTQISSSPLSYNLVVSSRGIALCVWDETADSTGNKSSWFVVQRPVKHEDGATYTTGKAPVHCIYGISGKHEAKPWLDQEYARTFVGFPWQVLSKGVEYYNPTSGTATFWKDLLSGTSYNNISTDTPRGPHADLVWSGIEDAYRNIPKPKPYCLRRFIVREKDIVAPYPIQQYIKDGIAPASNTSPAYDYSELGQQFGVPADEHSVDYAAVMNSKQQVAISEDNKYVITFPNGLNTSRYTYTHELDLIAYTSADVVSAGTDIEITVYGEATPRVYTALTSNGPNNTGMRILFLKSGGDVTPES